MAPRVCWSFGSRWEASWIALGSPSLKQKGLGRMGEGFSRLKNFCNHPAVKRVEFGMFVGIRFSFMTMLFGVHSPLHLKSSVFISQ